jgi:hypothetical protein
MLSTTRAGFKRMGGLLTGEKIDGRRNHFFVEKEFQRGFILFFLALVMVLIVASGAAYYAMLRDVLDESAYSIHPRFKSPADVLTFNLLILFVEVSAIFIFLIIMTADIMMRRISKSMISYERVADQLAALDLKKARDVEMRLFPCLCQQYLGLIDKYSGDILFLKGQLARIRMVLVELREGPPDMPVEKKKMAMTELLELHCAVKSKMAEYKLDNCL